MSQSTLQTPVRPRRRWPRRLLIIFLAVLGLAFTYYFYTTWAHHREIEQALAETDALDPRWRFEDLEADRRAVKDEDNSALHVIEVVKLIGKGPRRLPGDHANYEEIFGKLDSAAQLNAQQLQVIREAFEKYPDALTEARKLKDLPHGRFSLVPLAGGFDFNLDNEQHVRSVYDLLLHDAMLRADQGDPEGSLESTAALLNAARSLGDEPFLVTVLLRRLGDLYVVQALERTLAQGHPGAASLKDMQARLSRERADLRAHWIQGVRGERALFHKLLDAVHTGKLRLVRHVEQVYFMKVPWGLKFADYLPGLVTKNYADHLRLRNELVATAQLPLELQLERFAELTKERGERDPRSLFHAEILPFLPPDLTRLCTAHHSTQAILAAAETGLAGERFRLDRKRWPESLAELVKAGLLDDILRDPFTGQPLRFVRLNDGIAIYSVGSDLHDDGGNIDRTQPAAKGFDQGFRLWDLKARRQAPRPPVAAP